MGSPAGVDQARQGIRATGASARLRLGAMFGAVAALHVLGFGLFWVYGRGAQSPVLAGAALLAYSLGVRHAFDADHVAAIDDGTRLLMQRGQRPVACGFFLSLGHSTIVFLVSAGIALAASVVAGRVSTLANTGGVIGALVSGAFLYLVAALNLVILFGVLQVWRDVKRGRYSREQVDRLLAQRGLFNRLLGRRWQRAIRASWQMYFVGLLFGLGFDTASQIALITLTGQAGSAQVSPGAVIALPLIFAAGMSLFDSLDGALMVKAYGWAFTNPVRKVYYNITTLGLSIFVAVVIASVELAGVLVDRLRLRGAVFDAITRLNENFSLLGLFVVLSFLLAWAGSLALWRWRRYQERFELPEAG